MLNRILSSRLPLLAYHPPVTYDADFFAAVRQAGAMPVLDTECIDSLELPKVLDQIKAQNVRHGIRIYAEDKHLWDYFNEHPETLPECLIIAYRSKEGLEQAPSVSVDCLMVEVRDPGLETLLSTIDPHGLILKGREAGGRISSPSSYILTQYYAGKTQFLCFVHGGVGFHTAPGFFAAGAAGLVLDAQLYLAEDAPVADAFKNVIRQMEETDTALLDAAGHGLFRVFAKPGTKVVQDLNKEISLKKASKESLDFIADRLRQNMAKLGKSHEAPMQALFYLGQDAAFARHFAKRGHSIAQMLHALFEATAQALNTVEKCDPLTENSSLAREHGTRFPITQGPMANISDNKEFAKAVYKNGGLPFFALGSLPTEIAEKMLPTPSEQLPVFGAGMIGIKAFNPTLDHHLGLVKTRKAPFALFAGGIPSQINELEASGTKAYLHTPMPGVLKNALEKGGKRFIFEGNEAGGHIGSLTSSVLWELSLETLMDLPEAKLSDICILFAGGIVSAKGSHFISAMAAPAVQKGIKVGIQLGTAYLFTEEIVETGALTKVYQNVVRKKTQTAVIGATVGLSCRTAGTDFADQMKAREIQRLASGAMSLSERKSAFEKDNLGSLLISAKGVTPDFENKNNGEWISYTKEEQLEHGNFMTGDGLLFFDGQLTIARIHEILFKEKASLWAALNALEVLTTPCGQINDDIAVVGMGCVFPDAHDPETFWQNILDKKVSIGEVPDSRWEKDLYYDPDPKAKDKTYTKIAGLVNDFKFDNERFGYSPAKAAKLSRSQQMLLHAAYQAVENARLLTEDNHIAEKNRDRTAVVVATCLGNEMASDLHYKYFFPEVKKYLAQTPEFKALPDAEQKKIIDTLRVEMSQGSLYEPVHGVTLNMEAARIAHHLGTTGTNYAVDAACATALAAVECGIQELLSNSHDMVIAGGINTNLAPESFVGFSKMGTLSANGSFPFDARADGFVLGEGAGVLVLKRLKDAVRDNDPILGVIKGVASSSDGKGKGIAAPGMEGQKLAFQRCHEKIKTPFTPDMVQFIEAHGTGTKVGDVVEIDTLGQVYNTAAPTGVSSIKSQIGHLLGAAGMAGMIKALLALNHETLPPNGPFEKLSPKIDLKGSGLYILDQAKPWEARPGWPRMAAISAYGFGGINYHAVVGEFNENTPLLPRQIFADLDDDPNDHRIVFTGLGVVLPGARNIDQFWDAMVAGKKAYQPMPEERLPNAYYAEETEASGFRLPMMNAGIVDDFRLDPKTFRIPPAAMTYMDRAQLFGLDAAGQALDHAGIKDLLTDGNKIGVILGTISGTRNVEAVMRTRIPLLSRMIKAIDGVDGATLSAIAENVAGQVNEKYPAMTGDSIPGMLSNIVSARISKHYNTQGANFVVDASCASATLALDMAVKNLRAGNLDAVITGGVDTNLYPGILLSFKRIGILAEKDPCLFDQEANGYVMGEGAATLVVTTYKYAKAHNLPVLGELKSLNLSASAPEHLLSPSENRYERVIADDSGQFHNRKKDLTYLDVFGVSHPFLDAVEKQAIEKCLHHPVKYGNIKTEFGYFKAANPAVVMTRLLLMADKGQLLPTHGFNPDTTIIEKDSFLSPVKNITQLSTQSLLGADVNGIGGNHGHMVLGRLPQYLSADTLEKPAMQPALKVGTWPVISAEKPSANIITALLSGQGAQFGGMLSELYRSKPEVKTMMDSGDAIFRQRRGYSLLDLMKAGGPALNQTENTQPAIFLSTSAIYYALSRKGFSPDFYIGHSVGEYSALYCAGMIDFNTAMNLVMSRSEFMASAAKANPGGIMVLFEGAKKTEEIIRASGISGIWAVNKNSEKQTAVAGTTPGIDQFCGYLKTQGITHKKLALSAAFHTPLMQPAADNMAKVLADIEFNVEHADKIISNVTAAPYPKDADTIRTQLARQIVSPVEFVQSVIGVHAAGSRTFVEMGPGRLLCNLLKHISIEEVEVLPTADAKMGELAAFENAAEKFAAKPEEMMRALPVTPATPDRGPDPTPEPVRDVPADLLSDVGFKAFMQENNDLVQAALKREYDLFRQKKAMEEADNLGLYTGDVCLAGVAIGLPGTANRVFNEDNFDQILAGTNMIEPLTQDEKAKIVDMNITRVFKEPNGNARFVDIVRTKDVIQLAGKLGYFDLTGEYGISRKFDLADELAMAAGLEALKDAHIPLVKGYKKTSTGSTIPNGLVLPEEMQETTGVIMTGVFPGLETLLHQLNAYYYHKFYVKPYDELENIYYHLMQHLTDREMKEGITQWFFKICERRKTYGSFKFERNLLFDIVALGGAHFAQLIRAKGPNIHLNGACASTTQAVGTAEDWIRTGRCDRVIIIGGEGATTQAQMPWVGSGFLAMGAATSKEVVAEAAKPFDSDRDGTILGSGAVGLVVERADCIKQRGLNGQAQILGSFIGNSAFHPSRIDVDHLAGQLRKFVDRVEKRHGISRSDIAEKMVFMSHETYTPARGGSASAEVTALKQAFPNDFGRITITNTKGYTGHTLGAGIEDAVMVKGLQKGIFPPVANLVHVPEEFSDLNFAAPGNKDYQFGLHFSAGFGSHHAFLMVQRLEENKVENNEVYKAWLAKITGSDDPMLAVVNKTLCVFPRDTKQPRANRIQDTDQNKAGEAAAPGHTEDLAAQSRSGETAAAPTQNGQPAKKDVLPEITDLIAEQTGYTVDMLEPDLDLEADLGIDTVKQVETFGKITKSFGLTVPEDMQLAELNTIRRIADYISSRITQKDPESIPAAPTESGASNAATAIDPAQVTARITTLIAEQTGYTEDMLEPELDLEADLGIDTVKQVETFGKITKDFGLSVPEDLAMSELNTIQRIADYIAARIEPQSAQSPSVSQPSGAVPESGSTAAPSGTTDVTKKIVTLIAEQTGYTEDMLDPELDLEADLGIDTVKQVETFGKITKAFGLELPEDLNLGELNTIQKISEFIQGQLDDAGTSRNIPSGQAVETQASPEAHVGQTKDTPDEKPEQDDQDGIQAFSFGLRKLPEPSTGSMDFTGQTCLVTMDQHGFAEACARILEKNGGRVIRVGDIDTADLTVDLNDLDAAEAKLSDIRSEYERIHNIFYLHPLNVVLDPAADSDQAGPAQTTAVKLLFRLCQTLSSDLKASNTRVAAVSVQSALARFQKAAPARLYPVFSGMSGLLKTLGKEYPETQVKLVEFLDQAALGHMDNAAALFLEEVVSGSRQVEVGLDVSAGTLSRFGIQAKIESLESPESFDASETQFLIRKKDTLLVTGGACGITFELLKAVTRPGMKLVILGRSRVEDETEVPVTHAMQDAEIMAALKSKYPEARPVELKNKTARLRRILEARLNLGFLRDQGITVDYHAVDVTDQAAVAGTVSQYPSIDGVIHAAGVELSTMLEKKSLADFSLVFDIKVKGTANLFAALEGNALRYAIGFSSIAARFGNEAQCDYAAGNDLMGAMFAARALAHPDCAHKIFDWTAWSGTGMAAGGTVEKVLKEKGITFLPVSEGIRHFKTQLENPLSREILVAARPKADPEAFDRDGILDTFIAPFLDAVVQEENPQPEGRVKFKRLLTAERDLFLADHTRQQVPLFLGATGLETMAEAALASTGFEGRIAGVKDFKIPYGIKLLQNRPKQIEISAQRQADGLIKTEISSSFQPTKRNKAKNLPVKHTLHYQGTFKITGAKAVNGKNPAAGNALGTVDVPELPGLHTDAAWQEQIYQPQRLFMDGLFRSVDQLVALKEDQLITMVQWRPGRQFFKGQAHPAFLTPVVIMDAIFQTGGILEFFTSRDVVLPYGIQSAQFSGQVLPNTPYICITRRTDQADDTKTYQMQLADISGNILIDIQNFQMVKVDRLAPGNRPDHPLVKNLMAG